MRIRVVCADHAHGNVPLASATRERLSARAAPANRVWMGLFFMTVVMYHMPAKVPGRDQTAPLPASSRGRPARRTGATIPRKARDPHGAVPVPRQIEH